MDIMDDITGSIESEAERRELLEREALAVLAREVVLRTDIDLKTVENQARGLISGWLADLAEVAKNHGESVQKGLRCNSVRVEAAWNEKPGREGEVEVEAHVSMVGRSSFEFTVSARPKEVSLAAATECIRCIQQYHDWLSDGFEIEGADDGSEQDDVRTFLKSLVGSGPAGECLLSMVARETQWSHERWMAGAFIEDMVRKSAKEGLLPSIFESSRIKLWRGWPGEPTVLCQWDARAPSSFSSERASDALSSLKEEQWGWQLPSLDAGRMALWEAFAKKAAQAQARGWQSLEGLVSASDAMAKSRAVAEKWTIGESVDSQPSSGKRASRAL